MNEISRPFVTSASRSTFDLRAAQVLVNGLLQPVKPRRSWR
jgi:hypothetical protein